MRCTSTSQCQLVLFSASHAHLSSKYHAFCLWSLCINAVAVASQWQPLVTRAIAELLAASVPGLADKAVSDMISLGGSEPDLNRLAQAAENLNVAIHPRVTAPSSGKDSAFAVEWHGDKEDDSRNINQVLATLQEHVCDGKSQAVSVTSRDIFNSAQFPAQFFAKRIKLSPTKTDCLIVAKSVAELAVQNPRSIYHQVCGLLSPRCLAQTHECCYVFTHVMDMLLVPLLSSQTIMR